MKRGHSLTINYWLKASSKEECNHLSTSLALKPYDNTFSKDISALINKAYLLSDFKNHIPCLIIDISAYGEKNQTLIIDDNGRIWKIPENSALFIDSYTSSLDNKYSLWNKYLQHKLTDKITHYPYINPCTIFIPIYSAEYKPVIWLNLKHCHHIEVDKTSQHKNCQYLVNFSMVPNIETELTLSYPLFNILFYQIALSHKLSLDWLFHDFKSLENPSYTRSTVVAFLQKNQANSLFFNYSHLDYNCIDPSLISTFKNFLALKGAMKNLPSKKLANQLLNTFIECDLEAAILYDKLILSTNYKEET